MQAKLHFSNQVDYGKGYMNGTNVTVEDHEKVLEAIPKDVAMFFLYV